VEALDASRAKRQDDYANQRLREDRVQEQQQQQQQQQQQPPPQPQIQQQPQVQQVQRTHQVQQALSHAGGSRLRGRVTGDDAAIVVDDGGLEIHDDEHDHDTHKDDAEFGSAASGFWDNRGDYQFY
jgi:uncharacterized protein involved in type VI secretion and phage assembly